jgi:hypothetical protein
MGVPRDCDQATAPATVRSGYGAIGLSRKRFWSTVSAYPGNLRQKNNANPASCGSGVAALEQA